jgi:hypothetical protein
MSDPERPDADAGPKEAVPKLPRGRMLSRVAAYDLFRIAMFGSLLVVVLFLRKPCGDAVGNFFNVLDAPSGGAPAEPELKYERLTPEQIRERFGGNIDGGMVRPDAAI